jgi:arylsulfatase A-like enzyme
MHSIFWAKRFLLALTVLVTGAVPAQAQGKKPANILLILCDDVGYGEFGFQGRKDVPTPHIDSIARNGIRFTQGYVSGPYCSPTRAGLLTGRYQTRYGHEFNGQGPKFGLPLSERTLADLLKGLGYATCAIGKWHLGFEPQFRPTKRGFDEFYGTLANTPFYHPKNFVDSRISSDVRAVADPKFYTTEAYAERAVDWLDRHKDRPWFLYMPFNAQHAPLQAPQKYLDRFPDIQDSKRRTFAAMMSAMDDAIGRVLAKIRELGQEEETLIIFLSDNGGPTQQTSSDNGPLRGFKATTLEGGVRVPFCMQWKGKLPAGKVYEHPIIQLDVLPTCIAAAGGKIDPSLKLDGVNLLPYLTGAVKDRPHDTLYWRFGQQWAIRKGDWKLVVSRIDGPQPRLFNLAEDIGEAKDLVAAQPEKAKELQGLWDAWNAEQAKPLWGPPPGKDKKKKKKKASEVSVRPVDNGSHQLCFRPAWACALEVPYPEGIESQSPASPQGARWDNGHGLTIPRRGCIERPRDATPSG